MKKRLLLAALVLGAACSPAANPVDPEMQNGSARRNSGYIGSGHVTEADSLNSGGYFGSGNLVDADTVNSGGYFGSGNVIEADTTNGGTR